MPQLLVRGLSRETVEQLEARARRNHRSLESEVRALLEETVAREASRETFWKIADELRAQTRGRAHTDSAELIRHDRDTAHGRDA
jgi:plasmid stability protein